MKDISLRNEFCPDCIDQVYGAHQLMDPKLFLCLYRRLDTMGYHDPTLPNTWLRRLQVKAAPKAHVASQALYLTADG